MAASARGGLELLSAKLPDDDLAFTNRVFLNGADQRKLATACSAAAGELTGKDALVVVNGWVFAISAHDGVAAGEAAFSGPIRRLASIALKKPVRLTPWKPSGDAVFLSTVRVEVDFLAKKSGKTAEVKAEDVMSEVVDRYLHGQFLRDGQTVVGDVFGTRIELRVAGCQVVSLAALRDPDTLRAHAADGGILTKTTSVALVEPENGGSGLTLVGGAGGAGAAAGLGRNILDANWNFESMGIGGLEGEFNQIFRRAFTSRVFPPETVARLGIKHVKGMLLHGPPGTGKTLMARQIGQMLNGREPRVVNGPEILNKYVGQSEENIRELFEAAEEEYAAKGEASGLHIIIFDEIDALCRQRGSRNDGTGVHDGVVNQLLSKIDGVNALNNILVIGMTNRKDLLDDALLRAGRLEVHVEISLPNAAGRLQILNIHTAQMRENSMLAGDVDLHDYATRTKNFSGAEIETLVRAASSYALYSKIDTTSGVKIADDAEDVMVDRAAFEHAMAEVKPAFGVAEEAFETCMRNGIIKFSPAVDAVLATGDVFMRQVATSSRTPLVTLLLEGAAGSGKSAVAANLALASNFPYVKLVSPQALIGYGEMGRTDRLTKTFLDAYKSPLSCIVIDDIERLLDYVRVGPRFSNLILQTLLVLLRREPPPGHRLFVIATTSQSRILRDLELADCFNSHVQIPFVAGGDECAAVLRALGVFEAAQAPGASAAAAAAGGDASPEAAASLAAASAAFDKAMAARPGCRGVPVKRLIVVAEMCASGEEPFSPTQFEHAVGNAMDSFYIPPRGAGKDTDFGDMI